MPDGEDLGFRPKSVALRIPPRAALAKTRAINWKTIRLELAATSEFPAGSPGRAFLLRLPLHEDGSIDEAEVAHRPSRATVRRFWASEPDSSGRIVRSPSGWECRCGHRGNEHMALHLPSQPLRLGEQIVMTDGCGCELPFRVVSLNTLS
jgi:hypothetical protein